MNFGYECGGGYVDATNVIRSCLQMDAFKVGFSSLTRGELDPIARAERTESIFHGKKINGIKVTLRPVS